MLDCFCSKTSAVNKSPSTPNPPLSSHRYPPRPPPGDCDSFVSPSQLLDLLRSLPSLMLSFILPWAVLLKCHRGAHLHGNPSASDISAATPQPMGEWGSEWEPWHSEILLCNSQGDVICAIWGDLRLPKTTPCSTNKQKKPSVHFFFFFFCLSVHHHHHHQRHQGSASCIFITMLWLHAAFDWLKREWAFVSQTRWLWCET